MTYVAPKNEIDVADEINEAIDYVIEDCGIGYYEMGEGKYNDVSMQMVLTPQDILIQYPTDDPDQTIPTLLYGTKIGFDHHDLNYENEWVATLLSVTWNQDDNSLDAIYEIEAD